MDIQIQPIPEAESAVPTACEGPCPIEKRYRDRMAVCLCRVIIDVIESGSIIERSIPGTGLQKAVRNTLKPNLGGSG